MTFLCFFLFPFSLLLNLLFLIFMTHPQTHIYLSIGLDVFCFLQNQYCASRKEEEGESENNRHGRHWENMGNKSQPLFLEARRFLSFLHVPMTTALIRSFLPLPDSLPPLYHLKHSMHLYFLTSPVKIFGQARRKRKEYLRSIGIGGIGKTQSKSLPLIQ